MKRSKLRYAALVNCAVAIAALTARQIVRTEAVSNACEWILLAAWLIQGAYIFSKPKEK